MKIRHHSARYSFRVLFPLMLSLFLVSQLLIIEVDGSLSFLQRIKEKLKPKNKFSINSKETVPKFFSSDTSPTKPSILKSGKMQKKSKSKKNEFNIPKTVRFNVN